MGKFYIFLIVVFLFNIFACTSKQENYDNLIRLGHENYNKGSWIDYMNANMYFNKAIKLNPNSAIVYNNLGCLSVQLENYDQALLNFNKAIKLNPNYIDAIVNRGIVQYKFNRYDESRFDFLKAVELVSKLSYFQNSKSIQYELSDGILSSYYNKSLRIKSNNMYVGLCLMSLSVTSNIINYYNPSTPNYKQLILDNSIIIILDSTRTDAYYKSGISKIKLGFKKDGCLDLKKALNFDFNFKDTICKYCNDSISSKN